MWDTFASLAYVTLAGDGVESLRSNLFSDHSTSSLVIESLVGRNEDLTSGENLNAKLKSQQAKVSEIWDVK